MVTGLSSGSFSRTPASLITISLAQVWSVCHVTTSRTGSPFWTATRAGSKPRLVTVISMVRGVDVAASRIRFIGSFLLAEGVDVRGAKTLQARAGDQLSSPEYRLRCPEPAWIRWVAGYLGRGATDRRRDVSEVGGSERGKALPGKCTDQAVTPACRRSRTSVAASGQNRLVRPRALSCSSRRCVSGTSVPTGAAATAPTATSVEGAPGGTTLGRHLATDRGDH